MHIPLKFVLSAIGLHIEVGSETEGLKFGGGLASGHILDIIGFRQHANDFFNGMYSCAILIVHTPRLQSSTAANGNAEGVFPPILHTIKIEIAVGATLNLGSRKCEIFGGRKTGIRVP